MPGCFGGGHPRSRDLLHAANAERKDLQAQNQQLQKKLQKLQDTVFSQREEAGSIQEQQAKVRAHV